LHHIDLLIVIDLERGLGVQLLVRTTRSASPTENGQAWRWKARQAWRSRRAQTISECRSDRATNARFRDHGNCRQDLARALKPIAIDALPDCVAVTRKS
jgi:DNA-binding transcriptional LysR family regulator